MDCGQSALLPDGVCAFLPTAPTDGQVYIDKQFVKWVYSSSSDLWERSGTATTVPLATDTAPGYMSYRDKALLDKILAVPGGFGIVTDSKLLLQSDTNPDGVIRGNIQLKSESLDIVCVSGADVKLDCALSDVSPCANNQEALPGLAFKLSEKFLSSFIVNFPGAKGKMGIKGRKGPTGKPGFAGGPKGRTGPPGDDASVSGGFEGVTFRDINGITDNAIVRLDVANNPSGGQKLIVTRTKLNIPEIIAARRIVAAPLIRGISYRPDPDPGKCRINRLNNYTLTQPTGDPTPLNVHLLRLAFGATQETDTPVGFENTITLVDFVAAYVKGYQYKLREIDKKYGAIVKAYIEELDAKAKAILADLANQLALCEFNLPAVEYCITYYGCDQPAPPAPPPVQPPPTPPPAPPPPDPPEPPEPPEPPDPPEPEDPEPPEPPEPDEPDPPFPDEPLPPEPDPPLPPEPDVPDPDIPDPPDEPEPDPFEPPSPSAAAALTADAFTAVGLRNRPFNAVNMGMRVWSIRQ